MNTENTELEPGPKSNMSLVTQKLCMTKDVGLNGNLFGGNMLAWIDESAYIFAKTRVDNEFIVTMTIDHVSFKHPIKEGTVVEFWCSKADFKTSSMNFHINAYVNTKDGYTDVFEAMCVFVAVDKKGRKAKIVPKKLPPPPKPRVS